MTQFPAPMLDWLREQGEDDLAAVLADSDARGVLSGLIRALLPGTVDHPADFACDCATMPHNVDCAPTIIAHALDPAMRQRAIEQAWSAALKSEKQRREYREKKAAGTLPKRKKTRWRRLRSVTGDDW